MTTETPYPQPAPDLVQRLRDEADLCRAETADDIARLLDEAAEALNAQPIMLNGMAEAETNQSASVMGLVGDPGTSVNDGAIVFARVMEYQGKTRREVVNPCLTARECIALANYIHASDRAHLVKTQAPEGAEWSGAVAFIQHAQNAAGSAGADGHWPDEFLRWYKPEDWAGEHRAAAVFMGSKIAALAAQPQQAPQPDSFHASSFIQHVQSVADGGHSWADEFIKWYSTGEWLSEERAAAVFLGGKLAPQQSPAEGDEHEAEAIEQAWHAAEADTVGGESPETEWLRYGQRCYRAALASKVQPKDTAEAEPISKQYLREQVDKQMAGVRAALAAPSPAPAHEPIGYLCRHRANVADAIKAFGPDKDLSYLWSYTHGTAELELMERCAHLEVVRVYGAVQASAVVAGTWSVLNTGAEVADGLTYADAMDYLTPERLERGWSAVGIVSKDSRP